MASQSERIPGPLYQELKLAILEAYNTRDALKQVLRINNKFLDVLVSPDKNLDQTVSELIDVAESGVPFTLLELTTDLAKGNPNAAWLQEAAKKIFPPTDDVIPLSDNFLVNIKAIKPEEILKITRVNKSMNYYHRRAFDAKILTNYINGNNHQLLLGNPLAGKTRAVYELLKEVDNLQKKVKTLILSQETNYWEAPAKLASETGLNRCIVVIDDIDRFYTFPSHFRHNFDKILEAFVRDKRVIILATCRTGPEYQLFNESASAEMVAMFKMVKVDKVDKDVVKELEEKLGSIDKTQFDGNIGSLFMGITSMRKRWIKLGKDKENNKVYELAITYMQALKAFYLTSNFVSRSKYDGEKIKDFCLRKTVKPEVSLLREQPPGVREALNDTYGAKISEFNENFEDAEDLLREKKDTYNFIELRGSRIITEEVYLEQIVEDYDLVDVLSDIDKYYDEKNEKREIGFFAQTKTYNDYLKSITTYTEALGFFNNTFPEKGIKPNTETYSLLIEKSGSWEEALKWYKQWKATKFDPTAALLIAMIEKSPSYEQAEDYLAEAPDLLLKEDNYHDLDIEQRSLLLTNAILPKIQTKAHIGGYLRAIKKDKFSLDLFSKLLTINVRDANLNDYLDWIKFIEVEMDRTALLLLLQKAKSKQEGLSLLDQKSVEAIKPDVGILNTLIHVLKDYQEGLELLNHPKFKNLDLNATVLNSLLNKISSLEVGLNLLNHKRFENIKADVHILSSLIQTTENYKECSELLDHPKFKNLTLTQTVFNVLFQKIDTLEEGLILLDHPKMKSLIINDVILAIFVSKLNTLEQGLKLIEHEKFLTINITNNVVRVLITKATSFDNAEELISSNKFKQILIDPSIIYSLLTKATSTEHVLRTANIILTKNVQVNSHLLIALTTRLSNYRDLEKFTFFWENHQLFDSFLFLNKKFKNYEEIKDYLLTTKDSFKLMFNYFIQLLMDQKWIHNTAQKHEIREILSSKIDSRLQLDETWILYPDIQEQWDGYTFPT